MSDTLDTKVTADIYDPSKDIEGEVELELGVALGYILPAGDDEWKCHPYGEPAKKLLDVGVPAQIIFDTFEDVVCSTAGQFGC